MNRGRLSGRIVQRPCPLAPPARRAVFQISGGNLHACFGQSQADHLLECVPFPARTVTQGRDGAFTDAQVERGGPVLGGDLGGWQAPGWR